MARDDGGLELVRPGPLEGGGAGDHPSRVGDDVAVPQGPVLLLEPNDLAVLIEAGGCPGPVQPDQGEQAGHLGFGGHEAVQQRGEELGVVGEVAGLGMPTATAQVALVARVADLPLGAGDPLSDG